jgi:hypothetical protein
MDCTKQNTLQSLPLSDVGCRHRRDRGRHRLVDPDHLDAQKAEREKNHRAGPSIPMHQHILSELGIEEITHPRGRHRFGAFHRADAGKNGGIR